MLAARVPRRAVAARRISCVNNLKQIDLAIQGYLTTYNVLPSGSYDTGGSDCEHAGCAGGKLDRLAPSLHGTDGALSCV